MNSKRQGRGWGGDGAGEFVRNQRNTGIEYSAFLLDAGNLLYLETILNAFCLR